MKKRTRIAIWIGASLALTGVVGGFFWPQRAVIPVRGAAEGDWNPDSFWRHPWGRSRVHKGIDIFASEGTPVVSATDGIVVFAGRTDVGGNVVTILGPKWRIHYFAHLDVIRAAAGAVVRSGDEIGAVGTTGNAAGRPPHLHYSILTLVPYPWGLRFGTQGWQRMFYLDPIAALGARAGAHGTASVLAADGASRAAEVAR